MHDITDTSATDGARAIYDSVALTFPCKFAIIGAKTIIIKLPNIPIGMNNERDFLSTALSPKPPDISFAIADGTPVDEKVKSMQ